MSREARKIKVWNIKGTAVRPVDASRIPPEVAGLMRAQKREWVSRNSKCPCGSGKRFKRCCMPGAA